MRAGGPELREVSQNVKSWVDSGNLQMRLLMFSRRDQEALSRNPKFLAVDSRWSKEGKSETVR